MASSGVVIDSLWEEHGPSVSEWLTQGVARGTRRQYVSNVREWRDFASTHLLSDHELFTRETYLTSKKALAYFIYVCKTRDHLSSHRIKRILQSLRHDLLLHCLDISVFSDATILLARRAIKESSRTLHQSKRNHHRLPVTFDILFWLQSELLSTEDVDDEMTYVGVVLAFNFMLRCSEYCHTNEAPHALLCSDVQLVTSSGRLLSPLDLNNLPSTTDSVVSIVLDLCSSKTDRDGTGRYLYIDQSKGTADSHLIDVLITFCRNANHRSLSDPLLSRYKLGRRKKLHRGMISTALKTAATHFGLDSLFFSTHSLRIGGATCGSAGGRTRSSLCRVGGWSETSDSDSLYRHVTPHDNGILSLIDEDAPLLSTLDLRRMVPTFVCRTEA